LIRIGAYAKGSSPAVDRAVELRPQVLAFLKQEMNTSTAFSQTVSGLQRLAASWPF
jgi:flagellar biosynthesis/type III secretory pathway ATPase